MLCQFSFSNYKSYRDEVTLDMCPAKITEHDSHLIRNKISGESFLPLAVIYGPNGGGKSNVIEAFYYLCYKIINRLTNAGVLEDELAFLEPIPLIGRERTQKISFLFDEQYSKIPTTWSVIFATEGYEYKYSISSTINTISEESLYAKNLETQEIQMLFERGEAIEMGDLLKDVHHNKLADNVPLLSFISVFYTFNHINNVVKWFFIICRSNIISGVDKFLPHFRIPSTKKLEEVFYKLLSDMDIPISKLEVVKDDLGETKEILSVYARNSKRYKLNLAQESEGTKKILSYLAIFIDALNSGFPLLIDELDSKLHPKLLAFIISLFASPEYNEKGSQLILTSHDLYTMDSKFLRRDEIWFAVKREDFSSHLYSLAEFKKELTGKAPRKDENYAKQYTEGMYGADPYIQKAISWEG